MSSQYIKMEEIRVSPAGYQPREASSRERESAGILPLYSCSKLPERFHDLLLDLPLGDAVGTFHLELDGERELPRISGDGHQYPPV